jgi:hypothetical protein
MRTLIVAILMALTPLLALTPPAGAAGDDVCPEPNDTFQQACYLGTGSDALGFIASSGDVDAYRFEVRDFDTRVHLELADRPLPYRVHLANWNGDVIADGPDGQLDASLWVPGSYYAFVDSADGEANAGVPYRIVIGVDYGRADVPDVLYTREFRPGSDQRRTDPNPSGTIEQNAGKVVITMTAGGAMDDPRTSGIRFDPVLGDFTIVADSRVQASPGKNAGYSIIFRDDGNGNYYRFQVDTSTRETQLLRVDGGHRTELTDWAENDAIDNSGGVNRTTIRCQGKDLRVDVNGTELVHVQDGAHPSGTVSLGATTWSDPITVDFDNLLVTTPSHW